MEASYYGTCHLRIDLIMKESRALVATSTVIFPTPILEFEKYIEDVRAVTTIVEESPVANKKGEISNQLSGKRIQDEILISDITRSKLDITNCANYKHNFVLPIGQSQLEINHHNDEIKRIYRDKMYEDSNIS